MKETLELRINYEFADMLFSKSEGKNIGTTVKIVELSKEDPRINQIPIIDRHVSSKFNKGFYFGWEIKRSYSKKEIESSDLFHIKINTIFEPTGEECGTIYDESSACSICGSNRTQKTPLFLNQESIPSKDISKTIGGEVVVSEKFINFFKSQGFVGAIFNPIIVNEKNSNYYQLKAASEIELVDSTVSGIDPFDLSTRDNGEIYKCPLGHTLGLNLLSEAYVKDDQSIGKYDLFCSKQKFGVKRGLLRPEPIYLCSKELRNLIIKEKMKGFSFEIVHVE